MLIFKIFQNGFLRISQLDRMGASVQVAIEC